MKQISNLILCCTLTLLVGFYSCKKSAVPQITSNLTNDHSSDEVTLLKEQDGFSLTLKPGPNNGQDAYVAEEKNVESNNVNYVPELSIASWTINGQLYRATTYIRFDSLSKIPSGSTIVSAKLYLYSLPSSLSTPQGNYGDNACFIKRILAPWDESTIKYTNRPMKISDDKVILPASTSQWSYNPVTDVTPLVVEMIAKPSENYGFFIKLQTPQPYRSLVFGSSEQSDKNLRPKLVIKYN